MTTGTGAYGYGLSKAYDDLLMCHRLNLTAANRIYIVEPQWNPSVESQAVARAIRLGQEAAVSVTRYFVEKTVEQVSFMH
jgi:SWI/SNF-related matrix-associated actin-dependent regulator of chromatin subfamily A3